MNGTSVKELKEWLEQFPDDTEVRVAIQQESRGYEGYGHIEFESPILTFGSSEIGEGWEYHKGILYLGEKY